MKKTNFGIVAMAIIAGSTVDIFAQDGLILNFGPLSGSEIVFNGHSFNFSPATPLANLAGTSVPAQWFISSEGGTANTGSAQSLQGGFSGGPFTYGAITTPDAGFTQTATVNFDPLHPDFLYISDGTGSLQGTIDFLDVTTYGIVGGQINDQVLINLMNVTYSGSNQDLQYLDANQPGTMDLSFQFALPQINGMTLTQLSDGSTHTATSYSGSISVAPVPEPSSWAMSVLGGLGALGLTLRKRS